MAHFMDDPGKLTVEQAREFKDAVITKIERGKGERKKFVYAEIRSKDGKLLVSASLDYCCKRMMDVTQHF